MKMPWTTLSSMGMAWVFAGLGILAILYHYLPTGAELAASVVGLFLAGAVTALLLTAVRAGQRTRFDRGLVGFGYLLFAPVGLLMALLAPARLDIGGSSFNAASALAATILTVVFAGVAVGVGLGFTGGLAVAAHSIAVRVDRAPRRPR